MIIKFSNYDDGVYDIPFSMPAEKARLGELFCNELKLDVRMDKSHSQIVLSCTLVIDAKFNCDRCGDEFIATLTNQFRITYLFGRSKMESEDIDLYYLSFEEDKIDLTQDVIDYAKLSVPMKKLCSEECKGLCPGCGVNLNKESCSCINDESNPVWSELLKLKDIKNN